MNRKIITLYAIVAFLGLSFTACESYFDVKPQDSTSADDILTNEKDAQTLLNGMYAGFMSSASYGTYLTSLLDIMTDASLASAGFSNQMGDLYAWKINPGTSEIGAVWGNHYGAIYNANFLINNLHTIEGDEDNLNRITAEALTGRVLLHYNLVRLFGKTYNDATSATDLGVPYVTENKIDNPTRNSVKEVYEFMVADLEEAIRLLPENSMADNVVFTNHFAQGLMARIALDMKNYDDVIFYASKVIDSNVYALSQGEAFSNMWLRDTGSEIIWKVGYTETDYGAAPGYNFYNRNNTSLLPQPDYIPADWWVELYEPSADIRYEAYVDYTQTSFGWSGNLIYKYPTNPTLPFFQGRNMPKPMRLAEMYLVRAEAFAYNGDDESAGDDLDALLGHRIENHQSIDISGDPLKAFIALERKKELMFEGFYWFDLKRMNKGFTRIPQENTSAANDLIIGADDYRWQWPIPTAELNGNSNILQNSGY